MCDCAKTEGSTSSALSYHEAGIATEIQLEIETTGRSVYLRRINSSARKALAQMPELEEVDKLTGAARLFVERTATLATHGLNAPAWSDTQLAEFAGQLAWWRLTASIASVAVPLDNDGGGTTPATNCEEQYDRCLSEHNCNNHGWFCLCCTTCSLAYMACMAKMVVSTGGFRFIA